MANSMNQHTLTIAVAGFIHKLFHKASEIADACLLPQYEANRDLCLHLDRRAVQEVWTKLPLTHRLDSRLH